VPTVVGKRARVTMAGLLGLVMLVTLTGCGGSSSKKTVLGGRGQTADVVVDKVDGLHTYDPKKLTIELNKAVSFTVLNKDTIAHNVTIPDFAIDMDVQPGERIEVKLPAVAQAPRDGFFLFYCKYHQAEGEAGRIEVSR
jgi:plastocyanin